jgi:hypothetical protein
MHKQRIAADIPLALPTAFDATVGDSDIAVRILPYLISWVPEDAIYQGGR